MTEGRENYFKTSARNIHLRLLCLEVPASTGPRIHRRQQYRGIVIAEAGMRCCLVKPCKPFPLVRIALLAALTLLLSGWTTCIAVVSFGNCPSTVPQPLIISLSPDMVPDDGESVPLTVDGSDFVPQSEIMWNGNPLQTTFPGFAPSSGHDHAADL